MKIEIPFYTQHDAPDGWKHRACGITCVQMVLGARKISVPELQKLINNGVKKQGYVRSVGWKHDHLVSLGREGSEKKDFKKISFGDAVLEHSHALQNGIIPIISITSPRNKKESHLVVVSGMEENHNDTVKCFYVHDPVYKTEKGGAYRKMSIEEFKKRWRKLSIFMR